MVEFIHQQHPKEFKVNGQPTPHTESQIDTLLAKQVKNHLNGHLEITTDMAIGDLDENFRCSICFNVVKNPK